MRMSDWSSDVCSSDLRVRTQQRFALAVSAIAPVVERAPRSRECIVYVFAIGGTALPQRIAGRRIEAVERCTVAVAPARSEEHTSELQSLMRISYAVFCLKKKKKNTNTTQSTDTNTKHNTERQNT